MVACTQFHKMKAKKTVLLFELDWWNTTNSLNSLRTAVRKTLLVACALKLGLGQQELTISHSAMAYWITLTVIIVVFQGKKALKGYLCNTSLEGSCVSLFLAALADLRLKI